MKSPQPVTEYVTYFWQESRGDDYYRVQTNDPKISRKLSKRQDMKLVLWGLNTYLKVYHTQYYSPKEAKRSFRRIVGTKVEKTDVYGVLMAKTGVIVDT
jgi:hypothetical protein